MNRRSQKEYPNALSLPDLVLTIPATSTACEKGFSHMKLVKSDKRTLLKEDSPSNYLIIKLEGKNIGEFDPVPAINLWFNQYLKYQGHSDLRKQRWLDNVYYASLCCIQVPQHFVVTHYNILFPPFQDACVVIDIDITEEDEANEAETVKSVEQEQHEDESAQS